MRKLLSAFISFVIGIVLGVPGVVLALWVGVAVYRRELAFDCALWAAEHSPLPLTISPLQFANDAIQRNSLIGAGGAAAFLCWIGFSRLREARDWVRPADESSGGKARIVLGADHPRVGRPLQGSLRLLENSKPGQVFRLELSCTRAYTLKRPPDEDGRVRDEDRVETAFFEQRDIQVVQTAEGWSLPFRFDVPVTAPASTQSAFPAEGYIWRLAFYPADAVISFPSAFLLTLGPAPAEELRAVEAGETPQQKEAIAAISRSLGEKSLLPHQRAELRSLPPKDLAMARKVAGMPAKILMWLVIVFFGIPLVVILLMFAAGALLGTSS